MIKKIILKEEYSPFLGKCPVCGILLEIRSDEMICPYCDTDLVLDNKEFDEIYRRWQRDMKEENEDEEMLEKIGCF